MNEQEITEEVLDTNTEVEIKKDLPNEKKKKPFSKEKFDKEKEELRIANLELKEKVLRITAEMQNMRKRYELDLSNAYKYDGIHLIEQILPILDNFERAISIKVDGAEKFINGFKMVYDNLQEILKNKGITEIEVLNQEFNPNIMNAVLTDCDNTKEDNIVLEVLQKGYMYQDKMIRPATVKVNKKESE